MASQMFVAREKELTQLQTLLNHALSGRLQIALVAGEAGIGKTSLVTVFIENAKRQRPELFVASSKCYAVTGGQEAAYLPFQQILETVFGEKKGETTWDRLRRGIAEVAPDWVSVLPGVGGIIAATLRTVQWGYKEFGDQSQGADTPRRLVQYTNALRIAAATAPLLLWIDDLQWADNATLDLISFLADQASDTHIMLITAYRPTDIVPEPPEPPHPVKRLLSKLKRYQQCVEVPLSSFTRAELEQFLAAGGYSFPAAFVDRLWRQSGGNPLFIQEYVNLLRMRGLLKQSQDAFVLAQADAQINISDTLQAVIEERLDRIGHDLRQLLAYASIQGERFTSHILAESLAASELDVLEKLNLLDRVHQLIRELENHRLIVKTGAEYRFNHILIQQALYNGLSAEQRRLLHLTTAQLLENLYGAEAKQYAGDLAFHFEQGGRLEQAIPYYLQAGRNALSALALADALQQAGTAQRLTRQLGQDKPVAGWQAEALAQIAEAHYWKADYEAMLAACDAGEKLFESSGVNEQYTLLLYWRSRALLMLRRGNPVESAKRALALLGETPANRELQGHLYIHLGSFANVLPLAEVNQALEAALAIAESYQLPNVKARALIQQGWVAMGQTDAPESAFQLGSEGLAIAQQHQLLPEQIECRRIIAYAQSRLKHSAESLTHYQAAAQAARQGGMPYALHLSLQSLAYSLKEEAAEDWQESLNLTREAIAVAKQYHFPASFFALDCWSDLTIGLGNWSEAEQANNYLRQSIDKSQPRDLGLYYRQMGHLYYARGLFPAAIEMYNHAFTSFTTQADEREARRTQHYLGFALLETSEIQPAIQHLEAALNYWQTRQTHYSFAQSLRGLARVDLALDKPDQAVSRLREALAAIEGSNEGGAWPVWQCVCADLGLALLLTGEYEEALRQALIGYTKFKKIGHYLHGEAAFTIGMIHAVQGNQAAAAPALAEAREAWQRLGLTHRLPAWEAFSQRYGLL